MALHVAVPMRYIHERHFGRPACPKCGELEHVSAGLNRRIPEGLWMSESSGIDSILGGGSIPNLVLWTCASACWKRWNRARRGARRPNASR
jgi:hypothetical protein